MRGRACVVATALGVGVLLLVSVAACGSPGGASGADAGGGEGGASSAIGAACIPVQELSSTFLGFDYHEVTIDQGNVACGAGVCLVNHFQGRVTCPYGQNQAADGPYGTTSGTAKCAGTGSPTVCCTPGLEQSVIASEDVGGATPTHSQVLPGCVDRPSAKTVTCSCRCANAAGKTDDGAHYCTCPSGSTCTQVAPEVMAGDPLAGAYCIPNGAAYDSLTSCTGLPCDPSKNDCSPVAAGTLVTGVDAGPESTYFVTRFQAGSSNNCSILDLPTDASGKATCTVFFALAAGDSCASHPGLTAADPTVTASVQQAFMATMPQTLCVLPQLPPVACDTASQPGWCYLSGAAAPSGCTTAFELSPSGMPPTGATAILGCD